MDTKESLERRINSITTELYENNPNVDRVGKAIWKANGEYSPYIQILPGFVLGVDDTNGNVAAFLPRGALASMKPEKREEYLDVVRKKFKEANFEIVEENEIAGGVHFHVWFASHYFILKNLL